MTSLSSCLPAFAVPSDLQSVLALRMDFKGHTDLLLIPTALPSEAIHLGKDGNKLHEVLLPVILCVP